MVKKVEERFQELLIGGLLYEGVSKELIKELFKPPLKSVEVLKVKEVEEIKSIIHKSCGIPRKFLFLEEEGN